MLERHVLAYPEVGFTEADVDVYLNPDSVGNPPGVLVSRMTEE